MVTFETREISESEIGGAITPKCSICENRISHHYKGILQVKKNDEWLFVHSKCLSEEGYDAVKVEC